MGEIQKKRLWEIDNFEEFAKVSGLTVDIEALVEAKKKMQKQTIYGNVDLNTYDGMILQKLFEYYKFGTFENVTKMMLNQDNKTSQNEIKNILLEMAKYEIEYGLKPMIHMIPIAKKLYITAEGFLFYAENSGKIKSIDFNVEFDKGIYRAKCIIETTDGRKQEGYATAKPTSNRMDDPEERSRTKAMRRALRRLFPIGALAEEAFIEKVENQGVIPEMPKDIDIPEVTEEKKENVEKQIIEKAKPVEESKEPEDEKIFPDKEEKTPKKKRKNKKKVANPYNDIEQLKAEPKEELSKEPDDEIPEFGEFQERPPEMVEPEDEEKKKKIASSLFDL